jgi:hypothetical protein
MKLEIAPTRIALIATVAAALLVGVRGRALAQNGNDDAQWTTRGRVNAYVRDLTGPSALLGTAAATAYDQIRNDPPEWGGGAGGLGKRLASNAGSLVVGETVRHGLALALGRSTWYHRCDCNGFGPRVEHALVETFTDRDRAGHRAVSVPTFAGTLAGSFAQRLWRPGLTNAQAAEQAGTALVFSAAFNVVKELMHKRR